MKSFLCLGNVGPPLPILKHSSSALVIPRSTTTLHFSRTSTLLTRINTRRSVRRVLHTVVSALDDSRKDRNTDEKTAIGKIGASIAMACVVGIIGSSLKQNHKAIAGPRELYQKAPQPVVAYPLGGRSALKSLLDVNVYLASSEVGRPSVAPRRLPSRPSTEEVNDIKMEAVRLMKYGKPEEAVYFLRNAYNNYKYDPEPAYNVEMALVEILICQGNYEEALDCKCLNEHPHFPSDARILLYKAIIYTMLDEKEEAKKWWDEYVETIEGEFDPRNL